MVEGPEPPRKGNLQVIGLLSHWAEQAEGPLDRCRHFRAHKLELRENTALLSRIKATTRERANVDRTEEEFL